jgi:IMP dehydrogenase
MRLLQKALTFDDVLLVPAHSQILPRDVSLATRLTRNISLNLPLLSAAMDTVTEAEMAINMALLGGIGIIHKNLTPRVQAKQVSKVKIQLADMAEQASQFLHLLVLRPQG